MKIKDILADAATVAGCCVGAGFLSGKEAELYYGNTACVIIFVAAFCFLTLCVRSFAAKYKCANVTALCKTCCPKMGGVLSALVCGCCFVCIVAMIAGVSGCLSALLLPEFTPFYGLIVGVLGVLVVKNGLRALKMLNVISLVIAAIYLLWLAVEVDLKSFTPIDTPPISPIIYAAFSVTMALGVLTKLAQTDTKSNLTATLLSCVLLLVLATCVLRLCDFGLTLPLLCRTKNTALNLLGGAAVVCATVTGISANAMPITDCIKDVFDGDQTLCLMVVFSAATGLSFLGVDVVMKYGYFLVAGVGAIIVAACVVKSLLSANKSTERGLRLKDIGSE